MLLRQIAIVIYIYSVFRNVTHGKKNIQSFSLICQYHEKYLQRLFIFIDCIIIRM